MAVSQCQEFDPEDTPAEPMQILGSAQGFPRLAGQVTGQQSSLGYVLQSLASSFSEVLHPLIRGRLNEQLDTVQAVVGALLYAEQVTRAWAMDVIAFRQQRGALLDRWESARANSFGVVAVENLEPTARTDLYEVARHAVWAELTAEADTAFAALSIAAEDRGRQLREGPTAANVLALVGSGLLEGPAMPLIYPELPITGADSGLPRRYWGMTAEQVVRATESDPGLAAILVSRVPDINSADPFEAALALAVMTAGLDLPSGSEYGSASADRTAGVAQALSGIPAEELALLAALYPAVVGNLNGMPFENRIQANRIRIAHTLHVARAERSALDDVEGLSLIQPTIDDLDGRIEQYELLLNEPTIDYGNTGGPPWPDYRGRKIIYFDPSGDGSWAELVGTINEETDSVGVFVPGVGTDIPDMWNRSNDATGFVAEADREGQQLAMIVWAGGDMPDDPLQAAGSGYAADLIEPLADFSYAVQREIDDRAAGTDIPVTVIGHSYGGLTTGASTLSGLSADRLVFVNSPGLGAGPLAPMVVNELSEYQVYAMDAPGDVVPQLGPLIHGLAPTAAPGVIDLQTGVYADGTPIFGSDGHSGVFEEGSTAWENMLAVLMNQPVLVE